MKQAPSGTRLRSTRSGWSGTAFLSQSSGLGNEGVGKFGYSSDIKKLRPAAFWDVPQIWGTWSAPWFRLERQPTLFQALPSRSLPTDGKRPPSGTRLRSTRSGWSGDVVTFRRVLFS